MSCLGEGWSCLPAQLDVLPQPQEHSWAGGALTDLCGHWYGFEGHAANPFMSLQGWILYSTTQTMCCPPAVPHSMPPLGPPRPTLGGPSEAPGCWVKPGHSWRAGEPLPLRREPLTFCEEEGRRGRRKPPKCQQQLKGVGKFNLPTFPTNVTFGFCSDKLSAGELFFFLLFPLPPPPGW